MDNYFESNLDDVLRWELVDHLEDLASAHDEDSRSSYACHRTEETVHSLPRNYISLYGSHPKMEDRIYSTCGLCEQVLNPRAVSSHKDCSGKVRQSQHLRKKAKNKKKIHSPLPLPPLFKKESPGPPVLSKFSDTVHTPSKVAPDILPSSELKNEIEPSPSTSSPPTPPPPLVVTAERVAPEEPTSSRHKKSKKNTKAKEYDPNLHCGVIEGQKGPCTRSITCSNHKLRKSVVGRSKNIHVLIAEKKAAKEKESRRRSPSHPVSIEPKPPNLSELPRNELHDEVESDDPSNQLESGYCSIETSLSTKSSPVLYFNPISPIFVVTPVQFIQKENTVFVEATQGEHNPPANGYFLTMPEPSANIKLYKSHPKPAVLPTYGARKVGGAILGANQRHEYHRNDIQMAITTRRMAAKSKGTNKVNCKRASTDKLSASDGKQIKLSADINGFILHTTDVSEVAETANHCIQENINLLNMK